MRPRFCFHVPIGAAEVVRRIEARLAEPNRPCGGAVAANHQVIELRVLERDRHFWSPALSVTVAEDGSSGGSCVHGLVGPNPNLWTLFAMSYMGLALLFVFVGIFGWIQWWLGLDPWGLYVVPVLLLGLVGMYGLSRLGQRWAAPQTIVLRHFLEEVLELPPGERLTTDRDPYHEKPGAP